MKIIFTLLIFLSVFSNLKSQEYDEPYIFGDGFRFSAAKIDSSGQLYFFFENEYAIVDEENRDMQIIDTFKTSEKNYAIYYLHQSLSHIGKRLQMTVFSTQDSSYLAFHNMDTTIIINQNQLSKNLSFRNTSGYNNNNFWFSGYWDKIYTFDENTLKLDSLQIDSVNIFKWNVAPINYLAYKKGFLYIEQDTNIIHYYSKKEKWAINLDSIANAKNINWNKTKEIRIYKDKLLLVGWQHLLGLFDLKTWDFNVIDLAKSILVENHPDVIIKDSVYHLQPFANFDCKGNIYVSIFTLSQGPVKYKMIDSYNFEHLEHEGFSIVYQVLNSGRNSNWISGLCEVDGKSYYKAMEYFPDGTSVEAFPTIVPIKVYPNPAKTYTNVKFYLKPSTRSKVKFDIYNYMGQVVKSLDKEFEYDEYRGFAIKRINTLGMKTGVYYLVVDNGVQKRMFGFAVE